MAIQLGALSCEEMIFFDPEAFQKETDALLAASFSDPELQKTIRSVAVRRQCETIVKETIAKSKLWLSLHMSYLTERGHTLKDKKILEIGVSVIPFMSLCYLFSGATVTAIDKYRGAANIEIISAEGQMIMYEMMIDALYDELIAAGVSPVEPRLKVEDIVKAGAEYPEFIHPDFNILAGVDSGCTGFEDSSFDYIFSLDTLEHVGDPDGDPMDTVKEIARLLKPGGWTAHRFGPIDHRDTEKRPYDHFLHSQQEWLELDILHNQRTNRWVLSQWRRAFKSAGLEEVVMIPNACEEYIPPLTDEMIEKFHPDFKKLDRSDLETLVMVMILRKPE